MEYYTNNALIISVMIRKMWSIYQMKIMILLKYIDLRDRLAAIRANEKNVEQLRDN